MIALTVEQWARCAVKIRGAWPGRYSDDVWIDVWFDALCEYDARDVMHAVLVAIQEAGDYMGLPKFIGYVRAQQRRRQLSERVNGPLLAPPAIEKLTPEVIEEICADLTDPDIRQRAHALMTKWSNGDGY